MFSANKMPSEFSYQSNCISLVVSHKQTNTSQLTPRCQVTEALEHNKTLVISGN